MHSSANSCYHFQIADATGKSVVVEYIDNEMKLVEPTEGYQAATNFLLTPGDYTFGKGQDRYATIMNGLANSTITRSPPFNESSDKVRSTVYTIT